MTLAKLLQIRANGGRDFFQYLALLSPVHRFHPPSLKDPPQILPDLPTSGWQPTDSKAARAKARQDMLEILRRTQRQGTPQVVRQAQMPVPNLWREW